VFWRTDQFSVEYVTFLLDTIEASASDSSKEEVADSFLNLLLSFNQHFEGTIVFLAACSL